MPTISSLSPRARAGLVLAITALSLALDPINLHVRIWLRDTVVGGAPYWADHLFFMLTFRLLVWGVIGYLLLGSAGLALGRPERPREAWLAGVGSGLGLTALVIAVLAYLGALVREPHPDWPVIAANFASNFYEEFIFRGAILGLLVKVLDGQHKWVGILLSALLFCQGHRTYPPALLATVLVAGLAWAWMTVRYRSLWPAYVSHCVADTVIGVFFKA